MTTGETHKLQGQSSSTQPTLVLLHGSGDSAQTWGRLLPLLGGLSCLALDLPGHGERAERPGPSVMSVADYAASVRGMLARRGLEHVCLVGHSLGGAIALWMALEYPSLVSRLVLVGTGARLRVLPAVLDGARTAPARALHQLVLMGFAPGSDALAEAYFDALAPVAPGVVHRDLMACDGFDMISDLGRIEQSTLILAGEADRLTPPKYAHYLAEHLEQAMLVMLSGVGHYIPTEAPEAAATAIRQWLETA